MPGRRSPDRRSRPLPNERPARGDAASFLDRDDLIRRHMLERLHTTRRPSHFDSVGLRRGPQPEVGAQVVLAQVTRPCPHLASLRPQSCRQSNARADRLRVDARAPQLHHQRVRAVPSVVPQELGIASVVGDEEIESPSLSMSGECGAFSFGFNEVERGRGPLQLPQLRRRHGIQLDVHAGPNNQWATPMTLVSPRFVRLQIQGNF